MNAKSKKQLFGEPVLSTTYRDPHKLILFPKARLYKDVIEFSGYGSSGPFLQHIHLRYVEWIDWKHGAKHPANLILWFSNGDTRAIWVESAGLWKYEIEARVRELTGRVMGRNRPSIYRLLGPANETQKQLPDSMRLIPNPEPSVEHSGNHNHANQRG